MSDPAAEAANRVRGSFTPMRIADIEDSQVAAAREALKPIRKVLDHARDIVAHSAVIEKDFYDLVEALSPLIYTTEELRP